MALIKSSRADQAMRDVIVLDLGDLRRQGEQLKAQARAEAQQIIEQARRDAQNVAHGAEEAGWQRGEKAGYEKGLAEGRQTGHDEAMAQSAEQLAALHKAWSDALAAWQAQRRQMILDANQSLMELAVTLARKIIHRVPQVDPRAVADQVAAAVDHVARPSRITVRINPQDRPVIQNALPGIIDQAIQVTGADIVDDANIQPGGCVITYGRGRIDATLDKQLDRLVHTMLPDEPGRQDKPTEHRLNDAQASEAAAEPGQAQHGRSADQPGHEAGPSPEAIDPPVEGSAQPPQAERDSTDQSEDDRQ